MPNAPGIQPTIPVVQTSHVELTPGIPDEMSQLANASAIHKSQSGIHQSYERSIPQRSGNGAILAAAVITGLVGLVLGVPIGYIMGQGANESPPTPTTKTPTTSPTQTPGSQLDLQGRIKMLPVRFVSAEPDGNAMRISFELTNNTGRAVDSFKGAIRIFDQFGDHLDGLVITRDEPLAIGARFSVSDKWTITPRTKEMMESNAQKLTIVYEADTIIYADGTRDEFKWPAIRKYVGG